MGLRHGILHRIEDGLARIEDIEGVLGKIAGKDFCPEAQTAGGRLRLPGQRLEEGRFPGAVDADLLRWATGRIAEPIAACPSLKIVCPLWIIALSRAVPLNQSC
jgi:hypothetical protein